MLRAEADAILVGIGTVLADDPDLTCRLPGLGLRSPVRVVLDSRLALPPDSRLARSAREVPVWVFCAAGSPHEAIQALRALGVQVFDKLAPRPTEPDRLGGWRGEQVPAILRILAREGITRLLVEGGPGVARAFERATGEDDTPPPLSVVDEYVVIHGHRDIEPADGIRVDFGGEPGHRPFGMSLLPSEGAVPMRKLGDDLLWSVRRRR
jgi:diaminohydroxyphosphoribosylaminopyrimidine deaminase/5-amino-6-(5-phosphoribosylamino)uracil reductase